MFVTEPATSPLLSDDYLGHHIAKMHSQAILQALQGDLQPQLSKAPDLRASKMSDFISLAPEGKKTLPLYYKQRFLSFCFAGPKAELDKLQSDAPDELLSYVLGTLWQDLDRQLFPFAAPSQTEDHIGEVFEGLYMPEGGLMLYAECEPDVPLENIEIICTALEKVCNPPEP